MDEDRRRRKFKEDHLLPSFLHQHGGRIRRNPSNPLMIRGSCFVFINKSFGQGSLNWDSLKKLPTQSRNCPNYIADVSNLGVDRRIFGQRFSHQILSHPLTNKPPAAKTITVPPTLGVDSSDYRLAFRQRVSSVMRVMGAKVLPPPLLYKWNSVRQMEMRSAPNHFIKKKKKDSLFHVWRQISSKVCRGNGKTNLMFFVTRRNKQINACQECRCQSEDEDFICLFLYSFCNFLIFSLSHSWRKRFLKERNATSRPRTKRIKKYRLAKKDKKEQNRTQEVCNEKDLITLECPEAPHPSPYRLGPLSFFILFFFHFFLHPICCVLTNPDPRLDENDTREKKKNAGGKEEKEEREEERGVGSHAPGIVMARATKTREGPSIHESPARFLTVGRPRARHSVAEPSAERIAPLRSCPLPLTAKDALRTCPDICSTDRLHLYWIHLQRLLLELRRSFLVEPVRQRCILLLKLCSAKDRQHDIPHPSWGSTRPHPALHLHHNLPPDHGVPDDDHCLHYARHNRGATAAAAPPRSPLSERRVAW
ncbi:hypothetical protein CEXT_10861 [Caerostris extrusa]|uniref:Uncharacterized protein n=1 Tax=Caerostris extrusa TaxID=172846 RepID=A0AAV4NPX3_CAEEX|nr:hypothetical protein CEXT_10861 [Caerostris extrusa]